MRNGLERRREFAVLRAQGFTTATVRQMVTIEHLMIFGTGVITGLLASLATVLPILPSLHRGIGLGSLVLITGGVLACGVIAVRLASSAAVSGDVLSVLREE
jgi:ABC-type antimicrobial peptide transport system permease subunit